MDLDCGIYLVQIVRAFTAHRYWTELASDCLRPKVMLCSRYVKFQKYVEIPEDEQWKAGLLKELLLVSGNTLNIKNLEQTEIRMMIDHLSTG